VHVHSQKLRFIFAKKHALIFMITKNYVCDYLSPSESPSFFLELLTVYVLLLHKKKKMNKKKMEIWLI